VLLAEGSLAVSASRAYSLLQRRLAHCPFPVFRLHLPVPLPQGSCITYSIRRRRFHPPFRNDIRRREYIAPFFKLNVQSAFFILLAFFYVPVYMHHFPPPTNTTGQPSQLQPPSIHGSMAVAADHDSDHDPGGCHTWTSIRSQPI
jgi:hypothetical protein